MSQRDIVYENVTMIWSQAQEVTLEDENKVDIEMIDDE